MTASGTSDEEPPPIVTHDHQAELPSAASGVRWGRFFHSLGGNVDDLEVPMTYVAPSIQERSFTCPFCGVFARQNKWGYDRETASQSVWGERQVTSASLRLSKCENCGENCIWVGDTQVYPASGTAPPANRDMPADVRADYDEAAKIFTQSPRGAAALLRLAIQKLMVHLGQPGRNINDDIRALVAGGLPVTVQQALDVVRVTGNNAVHPGQLDANDVGLASQLFPLLNVIVEYQISLPARIAEMYQSLPEAARAAVARRDGRS